MLRLRKDINLIFYLVATINYKDGRILNFAHKEVCGSLISWVVMTFMLIATSCASNDNEITPSPEYESEVELYFNYEGEWKVKNSESLNNEILSYIESYMQEGVARHIIKIYNAQDLSAGAVPVTSFEMERPINGLPYDFMETVKLPPGNYVVKVWTDFKDPSSELPYYTATNFSQIMLERHSGFPGYQDAFSGSQSFSVTDTDTSQTFSVEVAMTRPLGRYLLIAEDFSKLIDNAKYKADELSVVVTYTGFYPDTYSVMTDRLTDSLTGEYYIVKPVVMADGSAMVGADFMLMNSGGSSVSVQLKIVNTNGEVVASGNALTIPMQRNETIILSCKLFDQTGNDDGGFGLDTGFDGDITIDRG